MSGVKYIDLENNNFLSASGTTVTIKGVYNRIKSTRKRIVLTNFSIDGIKLHDIDSPVSSDGSDYHIVFYTRAGKITLTFTSNDEITLTAGF